MGAFISPSAASTIPVSRTPPAVIHQQSVPTTFYSNPTSLSPTLIANNYKRNAEESIIPAPAPAGFTDESPPEPPEFLNKISFFFLRYSFLNY